MFLIAWILTALALTVVVYRHIKQNRALKNLHDSLNLHVCESQAKKADQIRLESELQQLNIAFSETKAAVFVISPDLTIERTNPQAIKLLGTDAGKLIGSAFDKILSVKDGTRFTYAAKSYIYTNSTTVFESKRTVKITLETGKKLVCLLYLKPVKDESRRFLIATLIDINDQIEVNHAYEERAEEAYQANLSKSMFLAKMSHEIRTPLHGVLGSLQLIDTLKDQEKQKTLIKNALSSGKNLANIINDIIDLSKIESGELSYESIPFSMNELIKRVRAEVVPQAIINKVDLKFSFTQGFSNTLKGDPTRIGQVLVNLLSNAVKFTSNGEVVCSLSVNKSDLESESLSIQVKDNGVGISKIALKTIFEPFKQADNSITRKFGGSGLGLAISKNICKQLGGDLLCSSKIGVGSTFEALIPIESTNEKVDREKAVVQAQKVDLSKFRVLMVEDNDINAEILTHMLAQSGCIVQHARDGLEAIETYKEFSPDIVLMDIHMPRIDGVTACRVMREQGCIAPILAVTANVMKDDIKLYEENGFNGHVPKPIIQDTLLNGMSNALH